MTVHRPLPAVPLVLLVLSAIVAAACGSSAVDASPRPFEPGTAFVADHQNPSGPPVASEGGDPIVDSAPVATATASPPGESAPGAAATSVPTVEPVARVSRQPFAMNLYRKGDFVGQYTFEWCVGASLQMAVNIATDRSRTSRADQRRLWEMARDTSFSPYGGANPRGWTATLNDLGIGPYRLVSLPTLDEAVRVAARAIRDTRRPVGLVMWAGRHAWVMTGFESTADPRAFDDVAVTGIRVLDPLYPHGSSIWGRSPKPNSLVSRATLARQFIFRDGSSRVQLDVPPGYLLVLPVSAST